MTPILKVLTEYCAFYIDDDNLKSLAQEDMPLYAWRMWGCLNAAIPFFTLPAEMQGYLLGTEENPNMEPPKFGTSIYTLSETATSEVTVELGEDYAGYELFCARERQTDIFGNINYLPTDAVTYNAETGTITISATEENPINAGTTYEFDFYTDGSFGKTLNREEMKILGLCFEVVWLMRFSNDWLSLVPKIDDRSFTEQNRANKENADTAKVREAYAQLAAAMRRYEQNLAFNKQYPMGLLR